MLRALLWDVDGTLAETERDGHRVAFNLAFEALALPWHWDVARYGELLAITGGRERLLHDMQRRADAPAVPSEREQLARELHQRKNAFYAELVAGGEISARPGVLELIDAAARAGLIQAITTTTSRSNVDALLGRLLGARWARHFQAVLCGEDVQRKKPDPEVYLRALSQLGLAPLHCVAIEDSPGGLAAARAASIPVIVPRSEYFAQAPIEDAIAIGPSLAQRAGWHPVLPGPHDGAVTLCDLMHWHQRMELVTQHP